MPKKPLPPHQRRWLVNELREWESAGVLQSGQASEILGMYQSEKTAAANTSARIVNALMSTAAMLVLTGVLLLISFNWQQLTTTSKLTIIFGAILATYVAAFTTRRRGQLTVSNTLFFLGAAFYGCGIMLISQIFHMSGHAPDAVWWWALGTLPLAVALESSLIHALLAALLAIWSGMEILGTADIAATSLLRVRFGSEFALTLPLLAAPGVLLAVRTKTPTLLWLYAPLLTWWLTLQLFAWERHWNVRSDHPLYFLCAIGGLAMMIAQSHQARSAMALPWRTCGVILAGGCLLPLSFYDVHESPWSKSIDSSGMVWQGVSILILSAGCLVIAGGLAADRLPEMFQRQLLPLAVNLLMALLAFWSGMFGEPLVPTLLTNSLMLAFGVWLLLLGIREERGRPFAAGVLYVLLWTTIRYFDLFGSAGGMLGTAALFFTAGGILFASAWFWKNRGHEGKP
jgi:uncharacterized membrane protein